ncbi:uncharacterized protein LOC135488672 [Lineus longissimus]|uniref:uncharacterized protein LOC135488672 n=1 Tax=Lineus longissimus TaxID=88925 RepID=UPI00315D69F2
MTTLKITGLDGLMSVSSFFELGELESVIDVLALYRCKACGFSSPLLDSLSEHITNGCAPEEMKPLVEEGGTNKEETLQSNPAMETDAAQMAETVLSEPGQVIQEGVEEEQEGSESPFEDFRCGFCPERFEEYEDLTSHQSNHIQAYQERRHSAPSTSTRPRRQRRETKNKPMPCPLCPLDFVSGIDELQLHFTCHVLGRKGFLCAYCDRPAKSWIKMLDHLNSSHLLAKTEQRRIKPEDNLRDEVDFEEQVAALSKITGQGDGNAATEISECGKIGDSGAFKKLTVTAKEVCEKVDLPFNITQKRQICRKIYTLGDVKRGRGRPRKHSVRIKEVAIPIVPEGGEIEVSDDDFETDLTEPVPVQDSFENEPMDIDSSVNPDEDVPAMSDETVPVYTGTVCSSGEIGRLFEAVEIAIQQDNKGVVLIPNSENRNDSHIQVVRASKELSESETNIQMLKSESRSTDPENIRTAENVESLEKTNGVNPNNDDPDHVLSTRDNKFPMKKKPAKPIIQTFFLYPKPGGGFSSKPVVSESSNAETLLAKRNDRDPGTCVGSSKESTSGEDLVREDNDENYENISTAARDVVKDKGESGTLEECSAEAKPKGISSFCPRCVLTKGSLAEIRLHTSSHMEDTDDHQCGICSGMFEEDTTYATWDRLKEHYEKCHKEKVVWVSALKKKVPATLAVGGKKRKRPYRCNRCSTIHLRSLEEVEIHDSCHVEGKERLFRCPSCSKETTAWHAMVTHLMDHNGGKSFKWQNLPEFRCHICGKVKKTKTQLNIHINRGHFREPRQCSSCEKTFTNWSSWRRHEDIEHSTAGAFKCDQCSFVASHSIALRNHMKFHDGKAYQCSECSYRTWNGYTLKSHKKLVHHYNGERVPCNLCGKALKTKASLMVHKKRKHEKQTLVRCSHCEFVTTNNTYLKAHVAKKHAPKPYQCEVCPYGTMTEDVLQSHMKMHTENRPYVCPYTRCYFRARDQKTLASHIKNSHTDDGSSRRFPCSQCNRRFKTITMLKNHMPLHTGEKPHKCSLCNFRGKHRSTVHRHIKTIHCDMYKKACPVPQVIEQREDVETIYIEVPQEMEAGFVVNETQPVLDEVTSQQVASIVAFENTGGQQIQIGSEQVTGMNLQSRIVPTVVHEHDVEGADMAVPADQIHEVIVESQVASSDVELLKHLMELASTNPSLNV